MIDFDRYDIGEHRLSCPECRRGPRDKTLGLTVKADRSAVARCFRCDYCETYHPEEGAYLSNLSKPLVQGRKPAQKHATLSDQGRRTWAECRELSGTALDYLRNRKCYVPAADGDVRWHPRQMNTRNGYVGAAMVALIRDALTGEAISLHHTWVRAEGVKADIDPSRMFYAGHRKLGGAVRLTPDDAITTALCITEGIETGLSLAHAGVPVWAALDKGNLASFPIVPGIEVLTIGVDNDEPGRTAAAKCAERWHAAGRTVRLLTPKVPGFDWNDMLTKKYTESV